MTLNLGGGDFGPYVKYSAKSGRLYLVKEKMEYEIQNPVFIADLENIKTGYVWMKAGQAPSWVMDASLSVAAVKPQQTYVDAVTGKTRDCYVRGFKLKLKLFSQVQLGGVAELSGSSATMSEAIKKLYAAYEKDLPANPGMLPVVAITGTESIKSDYGTNYAPVFAIQKWVARPAEFAAEPTSAPIAANNPQTAQEPTTVSKAAVSEF